MTISNNDEINYLEFLNLVKNTGIKKNTRNGITYSHFAHLLKFDISDKFPLLTTKKMFFKGIVEELLWFLRGSVNSKELESKGVNIWKGNSSREFLDANGFHNYDEGYLGPIYGYQWRSFNGEIDQLKYLLEEIQLENSRRILINAWNPCQLHEQALPPCHILYNFFKNNDDISCMMYMRSSDLFLGLPFNIASTALLTNIIAKVSGFKVKDIAISICDCHIYHEHIDPLNIQLERIPYEFPSIHIKKEIDINNLSIEEKIKWIEELKFDDFELINYNYYPTIKAIMK